MDCLHLQYYIRHFLSAALLGLPLLFSAKLVQSLMSFRYLFVSLSPCSQSNIISATGTATQCQLFLYQSDSATVSSNSIRLPSSGILLPSSVNASQSSLSSNGSCRTYGPLIGQTRDRTAARRNSRLCPASPSTILSPR